MYVADPPVEIRTLAFGPPVGVDLRNDARKISIRALKNKA
jgi:hypothetical protein